MKGKEEQLVKQKIRERYKGVNEDVLDVIPAKPHEDFYKPQTIKRVAVYARVLTDDPNQTSSYELQKMKRTTGKWKGLTPIQLIGISAVLGMIVYR